VRAILSTLPTTAAMALMLFHLETWLRALTAARAFVLAMEDGPGAEVFGRYCLHALGPSDVVKVTLADAMRKAPRGTAALMAQAATQELLYNPWRGPEDLVIRAAVAALFGAGAEDVDCDLMAPQRFLSDALEDVVAVRAMLLPAPTASAREGKAVEDRAEDDADDDDQSDDTAEGDAPDDARPRVVRAVLSTLAPIARRRFVDAFTSYLDVLRAVAAGRHVTEEPRDAASGGINDDPAHCHQGEAVCAALFYFDTAALMGRTDGILSTSDVEECAAIFRAAVASFAERGRA